MSDAERLLSSTEVAALFRVSARTVTAWATAGRLPSLRTPGGHHRFRASVVDALLHTELAAAQGVGGGVLADGVDEVAIDLTHPRPDHGDRAFPRSTTVASRA